EYGRKSCEPLHNPINKLGNRWLKELVAIIRLHGKLAIEEVLQICVNTSNTISTGIFRQINRNKVRINFE
ncbi:MAG: hypothetical protein ACRENG_20315, partial [bacterium]